MYNYVVEPRDWRGLKLKVQSDIKIYPCGLFRLPTVIETTGRLGSRFKSLGRRRLSPRNVFVEVFRWIEYRGGRMSSEKRWVRLSDLLHLTTTAPPSAVPLQEALRIIRNSAPLRQKPFARRHLSK